MSARLMQWLVFFFSRPIRMSDLSALANRLKPRAKAVAVADPKAAVADAGPEAPRAKVRKAPGADARAAVAASSMFHPELEIGVSEQPLDTLPADLQEELVRPQTGRLQGSLQRQAGIE